MRVGTQEVPKWGQISRESTTILLAAGDSGVLPTIREQKHLLHHRSHCRYRHRPQSAPRVLAHGLPGAYGYVGKLPRFDNQLRHLAALSLHLVDLRAANFSGLPISNATLRIPSAVCLWKHLDLMAIHSPERNRS